ncbi:AfsR/SARP family transcriptional regulator [Microbacterium timonense]|uniref:AfsR/SARP family transcriptional regulator n=1 Tax=Microbacterium timonense TaxID=2086576 RepID=UPI001359E998|nr:AfsR/SARP family transcriptional regulator [Microbacterium timonense]
MGVEVLGPLETGAVSLRPRERAILSALIVRLGASCSLAELADAYWGDQAPTTWAQQIRTSVARVREHLGKDAVLTTTSGYAYGLDAQTVDAARFETGIARAREQLLQGEAPRAAETYRRALALWRGPPYPDLAEWPPAAAEAQRLTEIRRSADEELLEARLRSGEHRAVAADAERLVREDPLREERWALWALADYRCGRQADALAVLRRAREHLRDELGIEPGERLTSLESAILRQDPGLSAPTTSSATSAVCPYRGLQAFGPDDADDFFGRDADIAALLDRARPGAVVVVVGSSGSGKSSLVYAGLLPRLRGREWHAVIAGSGPATMASIRVSVGGRGVLVIDQADALVGVPGADMDELGELLVRHCEAGGTVVMTLRSDFLDAATSLPGIGHRIAQGLYAVGPLSPDGLRDALVEPARRSGLTLQPGLAEIVLRDAGDRRSTLPHVSHALMETWARREGITLTVDGYEAAGGIAGAIAQSAESVFLSLSPPDQLICRDLMLRLIARGTDGASLRHWTLLAPLAEDPARRRVLERLIGARLVSVNGDEVTVVHEAIATAWPRLDAWLEEDATGARVLAALASSAQAWQTAGRRDDDLLLGARLTIALEWRDAGPRDLTTIEADFLQQSAARQEDERRSLHERAERDRHQNRRLRRALAGAGALLVVALAAGGFAAVRSAQAVAAAEDSWTEALTATAVGVRTEDPTLSALLAAEAYRRWPLDARTRRALMTVMDAPVASVWSAPIPEGIYSGALIPGSSEALVVTKGRVAVTYDVESGRPNNRLQIALDRVETGSGYSAVTTVSPDGRVAVVADSFPREARMAWECCATSLAFLDLVAGVPIGPPVQISQHLHRVVRFSEDGSLLYATDYETGELLAVDVSSGLVTGRASVLRDGDHAALTGSFLSSVTPWGTDRIVVGSALAVSVLRAVDLSVVARWDVPVATANESVLPVGEDTLIGLGGAGVTAVDMTSGGVLWSRPLAPSACQWIVAAPEHRVFFCGENLGRMTEWLIATGEPTGRVLDAGAGAVSPLGYSADTSQLVVADASDSTLVAWPVGGSGPASEVVAAQRSLIGGYEPGAGRFVVSGRTPQEAAQVMSTTEGGSGEWSPLPSDRRPVGWSGAGAIAAQDPSGRFGIQVLGGRWTVMSRGTDAIWPGRDGDLAYVVRARQPGSAEETQVAVVDQSGRETGVFLSAGTRVMSISDSAALDLVVVTTWAQAQNRFETRVYERSTGRELARGLFGARVTVLAPTGQVMSTAGRDLTVSEARTLAPISVVALAGGRHDALQVSDDGRTIVAVDADSALLYDLAGRIALADLAVATEEGAAHAVLRHDGAEVLLDSPAGVVAWNLDPAAQFRAACRAAGRELTAVEWATHVGTEPQTATCRSVLRR